MRIVGLLQLFLRLVRNLFASSSAFFLAKPKRDVQIILQYNQSFASTIFAIGGFFFTDSMPSTQPCFDAQPSLTAVISPLAAFSLNLYFPTLSTQHSKNWFRQNITKNNHALNVKKKLFCNQFSWTNSIMFQIYLHKCTKG